MLNLLPFPFNLLATAFLAALQKWVVPKIKDATIRNLVSEAIDFLETGTITPTLASAAQAHAAASASK